MITFLSILMIIACILLIIAVIIQNPKGGGLSSQFGGGATQMFGHQKTTDFIEKFTWRLIIFIVLSAIGINGLYDKGGDNFDDNKVENTDS